MFSSRCLGRRFTLVGVSLLVAHLGAGSDTRATLRDESTLRSIATDDGAVSLPDTSCSSHVREGYCNRISFAPGETVVAYLQADETIDECELTIYSLLGEPAFSVTAALFPQEVNPVEPSVNGFGFRETVRFTLPAQLASGIYLIRNDPLLIEQLRKRVVEHKKKNGVLKPTASA